MRAKTEISIHDILGDFPAGKQLLKNSDYEVVARVK